MNAEEVTIRLCRVCRMTEATGRHVTGRPVASFTSGEWHAFEAIPPGGPETAAAAPESWSEGGTRTPPVAAAREGEKVDNALEELLAEYGAAGRGRFQAPNGMVRRMLARAYRAGLQAQRRPRVKVARDTADMGDAIRRLVLSMGRRGRLGDLEALTALTMLEDAVKVARVSAAQGLHFDHEYTWAEVGRAAGISRQAAEQRWGG